MQQPLSRRDFLTWIILALGAFFFALGVLIMAHPPTGAAIFGIPPEGAAAVSYIRAVALRDVALGLYIILQTLLATRRAVLILLVTTTLIPVGDMLLLLSTQGAQLSRLPLHLASAVCFLAMASCLSAAKSA